jgi:hypothetical protein
MAHFAQINENNIIINVLVVNNQDIENLPFPESEPVGVAFLKKLLGENTNWVQTSYNGNFRVRYTGVGYTYDAGRDAFIPPKPYDSWILNNDTLLWDPPIPQPTDGKKYAWFEPNKEWIELNDNS